MRVLIVDDHPMVIEGCRGMLAGEADIEVLAALSAEAALAAQGQAAPEVIVLDMNMPGVAGFELLRRLAACGPQANIVVFSMNEDPLFAARAIEAGARGFIAKSEDPAVLIEAIRAAAAGRRFLSGALAAKLAFGEGSAQDDPLSALNEREREMLRRLAQGRDLAEIAHLMGLSYKTVANGCALMKRKLGARSRADLIRIAVEQKVSNRLD